MFPEEYVKILQMEQGEFWAYMLGLSMRDQYILMENMRILLIEKLKEATKDEVL